ncbi:MAG: hypothetical protein JST40_01630 [Armatimonadetes bacterium]|nr:hypothetical protein [Armatimonadota bacterium]
MKALIFVSMLSIFSGAVSWAGSAADNAGNSAYDGGWLDGTNGGSGFGPWTLSPYTFGSEIARNYLATNSYVDIKTNGRAWGIAGTQDVFSYAGVENKRAFSAPLQAGETFSFDLDNGLVEAEPGSFVDGGFGIVLQNASGQEMTGLMAWTGNIPSGDYYAIGQSANFDLLPFVTSGAHVSIEVLTATTFKFTITPIGGSPVTVTDSFKNAGPATQIRVWMYNLVTGDDHDVYLNNFAVTSPGTAYSGRVELGDYLGTTEGKSVLFSLLDSGGVVLDTKTATLDATGHYSYTSSASGVAFVRAKASHWISQKKAVGSSDFSLTNGDCDNDDSVTIFDYLQLSTAFDKNVGDAGYDAEADLDGDESVTVFDYLILSTNFDLTGE